MVGVKSLISASYGDVGISRRRVSQNGLVFDTPLGHPALQGDSFLSLAHYRHLATVSGALWTPKGRSFDGVDDKIDLGSPVSLNITQELTVEAWVNAAEDKETQWIFSHGTTSNNGWYLGWENTLEFYVGNKITSVLISQATPVINRWYHIVGTYSTAGSLASFYVDAALINTAALTGPIDYTSATNNLIGYMGTNTTRYFHGTIGEVRIYNRVLSVLERQRNYLATKWRYQ